VRLTFSLTDPDFAPRRFSVRLPTGSVQAVDVRDGATQQVQVVVDAAPGRNSVIITATGEGETVGADNKIVYVSLTNLRAQLAEPKTDITVLQQRVG